MREIEKERNGTVTEANALQVRCQDDSDHANIILRKLAAAYKQIETRFKEILEPQNEAVRQIRRLRDDILTPIDTAKLELTNRLMVWRDEQRRLIAEEQAKAEAKRREREKLEEAYAEDNKRPPGPEPVIADVAPLEAYDTTKVRNIWDFEVFDKAIVPEEYKDINTGRIRKAMSSARDDNGNILLAIPGVRFFKKEVPVFA